MTTPKTEKKTEPRAASTQDELRVAREVHTLAQLLYGELALIHPWITPPSALQSFEATQAWSPRVPGMDPTSVPTHWPW